MFIVLDNRLAGACAAGADALDEVNHHHGGKAEEDDRRYDIGDAFQAGIPRVVGPAYRLEHRPYAVREVEPEGEEPHEVDHHVIPLREGVGDQRSAVGCAEAQRILMAAHDFDELHFSPEIEQVECQAAQDDEAQYEHVFRSPFDARFHDRYGVALRTACLAVFERQDDGVDEVDDHACRQYERTGQRVPVGPQQCADHVVSLGRDDRHNVHGHVEEDKEHEEAPRHAHHQLLAERGIR